MTWIVVGASAGVGREIAGQLAGLGRSLLLVARGREDLEAVALDLGLRFGGEVRTVEADATRPESFAGAVLAAVRPDERIEGLLLPLGTIDEEDSPELSRERAESLVNVNFLSPAALISSFLPLLRAQEGASIVGLGSIADARGRRRNLHYGAAKRALRFFFEGLLHAETGRGLCVQFWVLGYHDTGLAFGKKLPLPPESPAATARRIVRNLGKRSGVFYTPRYWRAVAAVLRALPLGLYRKLDL